MTCFGNGFSLIFFSASFCKRMAMRTRPITEEKHFKNDIKFSAGEMGHILAVLLYTYAASMSSFFSNLFPM